MRDATKDVAATNTDPATQQSRLNMSKNLSDDALALVKAVKAYSVNPNPQAQQTMVDKAKVSKTTSIPISSLLLLLLLSSF